MGMNFCLFFILIYLGARREALRGRVIASMAAAVCRSVKAFECPQEIVLQVFVEGGDNGADFFQLLPV
jgi:hypothetical protein